MSPGEGPAATLDPHAIVAEQLIFDFAVEHRDAGIDFPDLRDLAGCRLQPDQIVEGQRRRQPAHRAERRGQTGVGGRKRPAAGHPVSGPLNTAIADDRTLDIGDNAEREAGQLVGLETLVEPQLLNEQISRTAAVGQPVSNDRIEDLCAGLPFVEPRLGVDHPIGKAQRRVVADQRGKARLGRGVGQEKPSIERQRAICPAPCASDLAHIQRHRTYLAGGANQLAGHALRRGACSDVPGAETRDALALPQPEFGERERPAHRGQVNIRRAAGHRERRSAAGTAQIDPGKADIAAQPARSGAQQRRSRAAAQVDRALAKLETRHGDAARAHPAASTVERKRAGRRQKAVQGDVQPLDPATGQRPRQLGACREAQQAGAVARKAHWRQRESGAIRLIRIEVRQPGDRSVAAAIEAERTRRQVAAAKTPAARSENRRLRRPVNIADPAVRATGKARPARARQLRRDQVDASQIALAAQRKIGAAADIGEHPAERGAGFGRQRPERRFGKATDAVRQRAPHRRAAARAGKSDLAIKLRRGAADSTLGIDAHRPGCEVGAADPRHIGVHVDLCRRRSAFELGQQTQAIGPDWPRDQRRNAGVSLSLPALQILGQRQIQRNLRRRGGHTAIGARQAASAQGADKLRADIANKKRSVKTDTAPAAPRGDNAGCNQRKLAGEIAAQIAAAVQRRADIAPRRFDARPRIAQHDGEVGQGKGVGAGRVAKFVERPKRQAIIDKATIEPNALGADFGHIWARPAIAQQHLDLLCGQVRVFGMADHDIR